MFKRTAAVLLASAALAPGIVFSQTVPNPTQRQISVPEDQVPLFRITVVGRTTPAINYRPRRGDTKVDFKGTALMPQGVGEAKISGEQGYMNVEARFDKFAAASSFGSEYLTYILWAVTPEGRATNLGEIQINGDDAEIKVTTELQAFGLIVTAEPYFAVTQPSDVVVMENVVRAGTEGSVEVIQAKYELLRRGSYLMNQDAARLKLKPLEPGAPLDLAQARNAVELARLAGADRFAEETFNKASGLLATAETAREKKQRGNAVMMPARQAAQTAEDARLIGLQRQEDSYVAEERARALGREQQALDLAKAEAARSRQADLDAQAARTARDQAERQAQIDVAARAAAELNARTATAGRATAERAAADADAARSAAEAARAQAVAAQQAAEAQARQAQGAAAQSEQDKTVLREQLRTQLNVILETRETARGLIVNLSDVLFDTASSTLKPGAREKLARVSGILVSHDGLRLAVEGHTDSVGTNDYNQGLSERRAESVRGYLVDQKFAASSIGATGFGEDQPVATNDTASGRQQNRRVELVVSGDIIGRR
ncbi:MAG TPA: OmpA family protein [Vicinamibacterales bacterium]|nr:OmpA family protein [Vicinamibacterales bacterium]